MYGDLNFEPVETQLFDKSTTAMEWLKARHDSNGMLIRWAGIVM